MGNKSTKEGEVEGEPTTEEGPVDVTEKLNNIIKLIIEVIKDVNKNKKISNPELEYMEKEAIDLVNRFQKIRQNVKQDVADAQADQKVGTKPDLQEYITDGGYKRRRYRKKKNQTAKRKK